MSILAVKTWKAEAIWSLLPDIPGGRPYARCPIVLTIWSSVISPLRSNANVALIPVQMVSSAQAGSLCHPCHASQPILCNVCGSLWFYQAYFTACLSLGYNELPVFGVYKSSFRFTKSPWL